MNKRIILTLGVLFLLVFSTVIPMSLGEIVKITNIMEQPSKLLTNGKNLYVGSSKADFIKQQSYIKKNTILNTIQTLSFEDSSEGLPTNGQWPYETRVADVNNDGNLDIIRLRGHDDFNAEDQGFQIWLGDGTGSWTKTDIPNGNFGYGGTAVGDFNNDGYLDAAYGVHHNRNHPLIGAWAGDGGTSFTEKSDGLATDGETWGMAPIDFGDFNNDGYLDIGVGSFGSGNGIRAYLNNDGGDSWESESNGLPYSGNFGGWLMWDDINRDGWLDIIGSSDQALIWLGDGTGQWIGNDYGLPNQWTAGLDVGNINNDGWVDITFIKHFESGNDDWYVPVVYTFDGSGWTDASNGLPNMSNYPEVHFDPLTFGDLDNDGNLDLVGLEGYTTGSWPNTLEWTDIHAWLGDGTGNWSEIDEIDTDIPGWPRSVTLADIDYNNYLDIVISSDRDSYEPGGLRCYKNSFSPGQLDIKIREPLGGDVYIDGGVRTIRWTSEVPTSYSTVTLQYSVTGNQGPWYNIVENITDSNYYQWIILDIYTGSGFIKATVYSNSENHSNVNPRPFIIYDGDNFPPNAPSNPLPEHGSVDIDINSTLSWTCSDPEGDTLTFDVYLEAIDSTPDILVSDNQSETSFNPDTLTPGTTYFWQIIAKDINDGINGGPIWSFITEGEPNAPPNKPTIDGPPNGKLGTEYEFTFNAVDPNDHDVKYHIDWDDGDFDTTGFNPSGTDVKVKHTWSEEGTYTIRAAAEDTYGLVGPEATFTVSIRKKTRAITSPYHWFLQQHLNLFPILRLLLQR